MKKEFGKVLGLFVALTIAFSSCLGGGQKSRDSNTLPLTWDSVHSEKIFSLNDDTIRYETEHSFLYPSNDSVLYRLNAQRIFGDSLPSIQADSLVALHSRAYVPVGEDGIRDIKELDSLAASKDQPQGEYASSYYTFYERNEPVYQDDEIVSIQYYYYAYLGGAHGMFNYSYLVYDRKNKAVVSEEDLFDEKDRGDFDILYDKQLRKMAQEVLSYSKEEADNLDTVKPNGNFYLTANSLVYQLNPYEVFSYAAGAQIVEIPYELIANLVKKDSPITRILEKQTN